MEAKKIKQPKSSAAEEVTRKIKQGQGASKKQPPASKEEAARRASEMKTQGKKGAKMDRINLSATPENYDFVKTMSKLHGQTMTTYINGILDEYRKSHNKAYQAAKEVIEKYKL